MAEDKEGKTLFEHLGINGNKYKRMAKSLLIMVALGFLIGTMLDVYLGESNYSILVAIVMAILWILKMFGEDLKIKKREEN